jgi:hypothetical protein
VIATDAERAQSVALDGEINRCACVSCQESFIHLCEGSLAAPVKFSPQRRARRSAYESCSWAMTRDPTPSVRPSASRTS